MKTQYKHNPPPNNRAKQFIEWCGENVQAWPKDRQILALAVFSGKPFRTYQRRKCYKSLSYSWAVCTFRQWEQARRDYLNNDKIVGHKITEVWIDEIPEVWKTPVHQPFSPELKIVDDPIPDYREDFDHDDIMDDINKGFSRLSEIIIRAIIWIGIPFLIGLGLYIGFTLTP